MHSVRSDGLPPLAIGIMGTRGIPNRYGGFEECAEQLAARFVQRGHRVAVYNPSAHEFRGDVWRGVSIIRCWAPERTFGTVSQFVYDLACINDARRRGFDVLLQLGYTSSSVWHRRWPQSSRNVINMDGMEWTRAKYPPLIRRFLRHAEHLAAVHADALIADSPDVQRYLADTYQRQAHYIPYGADVFVTPDAAVLSRFDLAPSGYNMVMARMEPENHIDLIIRGCLESGTDRPLVVVGSTSSTYGRSLVATYREPGIRFLGPIYDRTAVDNLRFYSHLYFHGHSVGGTNPSLLEAMGCRALIVAHDNPFNRAVLEGGGFYFHDLEGLVEVICGATAKAAWADSIERNVERIRIEFNWERVVQDYEAVFRHAVPASACSRP